MSPRLILFVTAMVGIGIAAWSATDWPGGLGFFWLAVAVPVAERAVGLRTLIRYDPWRGSPLLVRVGVYALVIGATVLVTVALTAWALSRDDPVLGFGPLYLILTAYTAWALVHVRARTSPR